MGANDYATPLPCPALPCPALPCPALPCPALPALPALPCSALLFHLSTGGRFNDVFLPKFRGRKHGCSTYWGSRPELPTTNNGFSSTRH
ncbi:TPA: hypothetical protein MI384_22485 [Klebsiella pneumoniae]|nr:hypothetical protein [Klebsiella pneumoniae]